MKSWVALFLSAVVCVVLLADYAGVVDLGNFSQEKTNLCSKKRLVWFGEITAGRTVYVVNEIEKCASVGVRPQLVINTRGGDLPLAVAFFEDIRAKKLRDAFTTYAYGFVNSSGNILFLSANKREALGGSQFAWHKLTTNAKGEDDTYQETLHELCIMSSKNVVSIAAGGKAADRWEAHLRKDIDGTVYSAYAMKELGVVTHILQ